MRLLSNKLKFIFVKLEGEMHKYALWDIIYTNKTQTDPQIN